MLRFGDETLFRTELILKLRCPLLFYVDKGSGQWALLYAMLINSDIEERKEKKTATRKS